MYARVYLQDENNNDDKKQVIRKALIRLTERLEITRQELSAIIGQSESSLSRLFNKSDCGIGPSTTEGQLVILLIRLFRNLDILFGGNIQQCRLWLRSYNHHIQAKPIELIQSIEGLVATVQYLDAIKSRS